MNNNSGNKKIFIIIIIFGQEWEIETKFKTFVVDVIKTLIHDLKLPTQETRSIFRKYNLYRADEKKEIYPKQSFLDAGIQNGETLFLKSEIIQSSYYEYQINRVVLKHKNAIESPNKNYQLVLRLLPSGLEIDFECSSQTLGGEIIETLINNQDLEIPKFDFEGEKYIYKLTSKGSGKEIKWNSSLFSTGVNDGDTILFMPTLYAGGPSGSLTFEFPSKINIGERGISIIRISKSILQKELLKKGLLSDKDIRNIEISNLMSVELEENSLSSRLLIKPFNTPEQIVNNNFFTEWKFGLVPQQKGTTSIIIRISIIEKIEGLGIHKKDVFTANQNIEIGQLKSENIIQTGSIVDETFSSLEGFKHMLYHLIGNNKTGVALSKLAYFFSKRNRDLHNSIILLLGQWNHGKTENSLNRLSLNDWMVNQTRINQGILEIMKSIEKEDFSTSSNSTILNQMENSLSQTLTKSS